MLLAMGVIITLSITYLIIQNKITTLQLANVTLTKDNSSLKSDLKLQSNSYRQLHRQLTTQKKAFNLLQQEMSIVDREIREGEERLPILISEQESQNSYLNTIVDQNIVEELYR